MASRALIRRNADGFADAFTLVELMVSMAVLTLLVLAVGQLVDGAARVSVGERQHLEADGQARLVFDRMSLDFEKMLKRKDVDYVFSQQAGNDKMFFYSEAPAYFDGAVVPDSSAQSPLSLIGYRVNNADQANPYQLARLSKGLTWDESKGTDPGAVVFLTSPPSSATAASPTPYPASTLAGHWPTTIGASPDYNGSDTVGYHVLAEGVCRMEICFLLKPAPQTDGTTLPAIYSINPYRAPHAAANGMQDVQAVVVALVVSDNASRRIATDLSGITAAFPDVTTTNLTASPPVLMSQLWQAQIDQNKVAFTAHIPRAAAAQLRVYQRHFYLNTQ